MKADSLGEILTLCQSSPPPPRMEWTRAIYICAMSIVATPVPLSEAKTRLSGLARRVREQHERIA